MQYFNEAFKKLNDRQRQAVVTTEGPVMVLAGPGTGKTEILAVRIGHLLNQPGINSNNILCLTYSNSGVNAMKGRLSELIGGEAEKISVFTFHSFAKKLLDSNSSDFFSGRTLISDAERYMLIEKLIHDYLVPEDPGYLKPSFNSTIKKYAEIFNVIRQENLNQDSIIELANRCINDIMPLEEEYNLQNGNGFNKKGRDLAESINWFSTRIAKMYDEYEKELEKRNMFEFEHMLNEAILLLESNQNLLVRLKENYQYILVDEYQDTNLKQIAILDILTKGEVKPNIFVVGDDDQCIYRFQGASEKNFSWIRKRFNHDLCTITLNLNYRSTPVILQYAFGLIQQNDNRQPEKVHPLLSGNSKYNSATHPHPEIMTFQSADHEAYFIANMIKEKIAKGVKPPEIAVLAGTRNDYSQVGKWLNSFGIDTRINQNWDDLLKSPLGKILFNLLQFIRAREGNVYLAEGFLLQALLYKNYYAYLIQTFLQSKTEESRDFYKWLTNYDGISEKMKILLSDICILLNSKNETLSENITQILFSLATSDLSDHIDKRHIDAWFKFIVEFKNASKITSIESLAELIWYYYQNNIPIKVDLEKKNNDEAVVLSTIHGSKGLEYEHVYLIATHDKKWENKSSSRDVQVPKILNRFIVPEANSDDDFRRLLYVACTRAKINLTISHCRIFSNKPAVLTKFLHGYKNSTSVVYAEIPEFEIPTIDKDTYVLDADNELLNLIKHKITEYKLSPSALSVWERCQNEFLYNSILKIPSGSNESASFGTLFHEIMKVIGNDISIQYNQTSLNNLIDDLMVKHKYNFHSTHVEKYKAYAKYLVQSYLNAHPIIGRPFKIENTFFSEIDGRVKMKGQLDRVEMQGNTVKVIDYKTGSLRETSKPFKNENEPGTKYWRQAYMYTLLMMQNFEAAQGFKFEFHYPELKPVISVFNYEKNNAFEEFIGSVWDNIQNLRFQKSCGNKDCIYCKLDLTKIA